MIKNSIKTKLYYIPAQSGWIELIEVHELDGTFHSFIEEPIICWEVESMTSIDPNDIQGSAIDIFPITIDGKRGGVNDQCILRRPNGTYFIRNDQEFNSLEDLIKFKKGK